MTQHASRPFIPNPPPELPLPEPVQPPAHIAARERLATVGLLAALVFVAGLWAMVWVNVLLAWLGFWWLLVVGLPVFVALVVGVAYLTLGPLQSFHALRLWLLSAQSDVYARQRGQTVQRRVYVLHYQRSERVSAPEPPRIITIRAPADSRPERSSESARPVDVTARVVVTPPPAQGTTARYDASDTQRLERFALPAPPDLPGKAHWMRQYLKPSGTPPSWRTCKPNMSETEWRASCAALVAIGELEDLGNRRGFRWR